MDSYTPVCHYGVLTHHMYVDVLFEKDKTAVVIFLNGFDLRGSIVYQLIVSRRAYPLVTVICAWFDVVIECLHDH